ncbi:MAG: DUF624 domain-containing protein [Anaerolineales bacterium]|nr:DUF624 domain-containing protein [Anaerolineales bacterium]
MLRDWLEDAWNGLAEIVIANLLWLLLSLPLVTAAPAAAALYHVTNRLAHGQEAGWRVFFQGFKQHFWLSWRWLLLNLLAVAVLLANYLFYARFRESWAALAQGAFVGLAVLWAAIQVYVFPLLLEQSDRRLRTALRNSLVMYLRRPLLALGVACTIGLLAYLTTLFVWPAWVAITAGLCAYLANRVVILIVGELLEE